MQYLFKNILVLIEYEKNAYLAAKRVGFFPFFPFVEESKVLQPKFRSSYLIYTYALVLSATQSFH